jgi:hypothetical protein
VTDFLLHIKKHINYINEVCEIKKTAFEKYMYHNLDYTSSLLFLSSSFLGSTSQLRPWPPPQNLAEFLGGFSTIFFFTG